MTLDAHLNRLLGSPPPLHKRQVDPLNTSTEAFDFGHRYFELECLIS